MFVKWDILQLPVEHLVDVNGSWNWDMFQHALPNQILTHIDAMKPPVQEDGEDEVFWLYPHPKQILQLIV